MEQIYMIEFFVNKVKVFGDPDNHENLTPKKLVIYIQFGPRTTMVVRESLGGADSDLETEWEIDKITGRNMWTRQLRAGNAYMFPSYADSIMQVISKFPLKVSVWNEDESEAEKKIFVGIGSAQWHPKFYKFLVDSVNPKIKVEPGLHKESVLLYDDCCCSIVGYVDIILRMSAFGGFIITTFQQKGIRDDDDFLFASNASTAVYEGKRFEGDDGNFCMLGPLYESTTLEDPGDPIDEIKKCKRNKNCLEENELPGEGENFSLCGVDRYDIVPKLPINEIRIGDITGPCGNRNCSIAQKIKLYLRSTEAYKRQAPSGFKPANTRKQICGLCMCRTKKWHRETCPVIKQRKELGDASCPQCGNLSKPVHACNTVDMNVVENEPEKGVDEPYTGCTKVPENETDCLCQREPYSTTCKADDCECTEERVKRETRKLHRPYCPSYVHKYDCPVTLMLEASPDENEAEEVKPEKPAKEDDEDEQQNPFALPPLNLGPCPVTAKPCTYPYGFARVMKFAEQPPTYPSYSDAGKICCRAEFERVKSFLKELMKEERQPHNFKCANKLNIASLKSCCDKSLQIGHLDKKLCCPPLELVKDIKD